MLHISILNLLSQFPIQPRHPSSKHLQVFLNLVSSIDKTLKNSSPWNPL
ncbi:hypothetical protein [Gloeocapsopsis sp. IPPAS B-1203]